MSAILSADDLNDFISPGVACIKPVETLPEEAEYNPYEVTTEDKVQPRNPAPASVSLTDCLACSGCVTSAEAVLVSLQSHTEVLNTLDACPSLEVDGQLQSLDGNVPSDAKLFVASVSPQVRASLAATFGVSEKRSGYIIEQFLSGSEGLRLGGKYKNRFTYVLDTNRMREACLVLAADEVAESISNTSHPKPVLTSACPGWVCYAEKTHPHILPHLSALKSPQALTGTLLKSVLSKKLNIHPSQIWHLAIMPCFDKKLEASREELTHKWWSDDASVSPVRDVDCVITSRELLTLAEARGITLAALPQTPLPTDQQVSFPDQTISSFLFSNSSSSTISSAAQTPEFGTSGGYLAHILQSKQSSYPNSTISIKRGRNADVIEYTLERATQAGPEPILKAARYYGFKNIQNLVRKLQPAKQSKLPGASMRRNNGSSTSNFGSEYAYIEVMACPGGCTNGGGQVKFEDISNFDSSAANIAQMTAASEQNPSQIDAKTTQATNQKEWLAKVDEAYFSADSDTELDSDNDVIFNNHTNGHKINGQVARKIDTEGDVTMSEAINDSDDNKNINNDTISQRNAKIHEFLSYWSSLTGVSLDKLTTTTFRKVDSDVGKSTKKSMAKKMGDSERIAAIAGLQGGGW